MKENKINIHISDNDFYLENTEVRNEEVTINATGDTYGRFIFTEYPRVVVRGVKFVNSSLSIIGPFRGSLITNNWFYGVCIEGIASRT